MTSQKKILVPSEDSESWRLLLADPETQWQSGYSAKCIAESWERFGDFPQEIKSLFNNCHLLEGSELLLAIRIRIRPETQE